MGAVTAITAGLAVAGAIGKTVSGAKQKREAKQLMDNYVRQDIKNPYENLKVSTQGAMLQQKNAAQQTATAMDNLRKSGSRSVIGGTGNVVGQNMQTNQAIAADLDKQVIQNERLEAQGEAKAQDMMERREEADLAGIGQQMEVGNQNMWSGMTEGLGALAVGGRALDELGNEEQTLGDNLTDSAAATNYGNTTAVDIKSENRRNKVLGK